MTQTEEEEGEIEILIREYQQNTVPDTWDLRLMELYGGTEWRTSERDDVKRCIQRILVRKLEGNYQNNSSEEIRGELGGRVGEIWREGQGSGFQVDYRVQDSRYRLIFTLH